MTKLSIATLLLFIALIFPGRKSIAQSPETPGSYMTAISDAQEEMNQKYMAYLSAASHSSRKRKIEKLRKAALESIEAARYKTIDLPIYKGDNSLRQTGIDYIKFCYNIFNDDYGKIVNMEEIAEQSFDEMEAYLLLQEKTDEKIKEANEKMNAGMQAFAAKYNVNIINSKSELGEKLGKAGALTRYRNAVYLIFFKCYWQDGEIVKSMNNGKLTEIEQGRNSLIRFAEEGLKGLDTLKNFESDPSLASTCRQVLYYYKNMAERDIPKQTDYFLKKENFEKLKKDYDRNEQTKESVNAYNKTVKEVNTATSAFNETNNKVNKERNEALNKWNEGEKKFMDDHMPHYK